MQICENCKQEVKWIAISNREVAKCEPVETEFVTETGRKTRGYLLHVCKEDKQEETRISEH